jgi:hypothetical protein
MRPQKAQESGLETCDLPELGTVEEAALRHYQLHLADVADVLQRIGVYDY